jgi:uncharacterized SAM-binding protein YcdF (DUF218 family)
MSLYRSPGNSRAARAARLALRLRLLGLAVALVVLGWLGGFTWFIATLPLEERSARKTDGIVALTGGPARLDEAAILLAEGRAQRLLISGVNPETSAEAIQQTLNLSPALFACCVDLGREAADTVGNARETAAWAARNQFHSLRVVTFAAHMPRSLVELRAALPADVEMIAHPVLTERVRPANWAAHPAAALSLAHEFSKYVVSLVRWRAFNLAVTMGLVPGSTAADTRQETAS